VAPHANPTPTAMNISPDQKSFSLFIFIVVSCSHRVGGGFYGWRLLRPAVVST
jgi:hypothetical protein